MIKLKLLGLWAFLAAAARAAVPMSGGAVLSLLVYLLSDAYGWKYRAQSEDLTECGKNIISQWSTLEDMAISQVNICMNNTAIQRLSRLSFETYVTTK